MGYGDIEAYNPESLVPTPNLNQLALDGIRFTDAHSPSAVCTPSRYALLTGRYAWRTRLKSGVLWGYSPLLIEDGRQTLATMLKAEGYKTAAFGKWHLGFGRSEADYYSSEQGADTDDEFAGLRPGPNEVGFDYFYGIPASLDMKPYVFVENGVPVTPLDGDLVEASEHRRKGGDGFWRKGQLGAGFDHQKVLTQVTDKAVAYIKERSNGETQQPYFAYIALTAPHTPWLPEEEFRDVSGAGYYGDFAAQVDSVVGRIMNALAEVRSESDTLVIFTSDNGAHWLPSDIEKYGHAANGTLRGQKADIYEGGHRVPFILRWPGHIPANSDSSQQTTFTDLMVTLASIVGATVDRESAVDSFDISQSVLGESRESVRQAPLVHHALDGMFAIRDGEWKLIEGLGSGGFTAPRREQATPGEIHYQLFNLVDDPQETRNVASEFPDIVRRLAKSLDQIRFGE